MTSTESVKDAPTLLKELFAHAIESRTSGSSETDAATRMKYFDPNVVVHQPDSLPWGGVHRGIDAFTDVVAKIMKSLDVGSFEIRDILGREDYAMVLSYSRWNLTDGTTYEGYQSEHTWWRNGKIVEVRVFWFDTAAVRNAAFA